MKRAAWIPLALVFALSACDRADDARATHDNTAESPAEHMDEANDAGPKAGVSPDEPYVEVLDTTPDAAEEDAAEDAGSQP